MPGNGSSNGADCAPVALELEARGGTGCDEHAAKSAASVAEAKIAATVFMEPLLMCAVPVLADVSNIGGSERRPGHQMRIDDGAMFGVDFALDGDQRAAGDLIGKKLRSGPGAILFALG